MAGPERFRILPIASRQNPLRRALEQAQVGAQVQVAHPIDDPGNPCAAVEPGPITAMPTFPFVFVLPSSCGRRPRVDRRPQPTAHGQLLEARYAGLDGINSVPTGRVAVPLTMAWLSRIALPGRELPADALWQVEEAEVMTAADYDTITSRGWWPFLADYLPRVIDPVELAEHLAWVNTELPGVVQRFRSRGYVPVSCGGTTIPFECLCGGRSMAEFFVDLASIPETVRAAMDVIQPDLVQLGVTSARQSGVPAVWVGGWRAASAMLSPKMWETFVFPYYLDMVTRLAAAGIVSVLHFDQDWTRDLRRLRELPAKSCLLNLDGWTDIRRAKEILGDHMALMGDVPSPLLTTGTPDDVYAYVRDLVRDVGPSGLILCPGCDAPLNAKLENMEAFVAASEEYGRGT